MSQFGLLLITDAETVESACRGWRRPLAEPVKKTITNPFTGEPTEVTTYFPEGIDELTGCAPLDEVTETLRAAKPIAIDFQLHSLRRGDFIENAKPFLIGNDELGTITLKRVPIEWLPDVAQHFGDQLAPYDDPARLEDEGLAIFLLVYSF